MSTFDAVMGQLKGELDSYWDASAREKARPMGHRTPLYNQHVAANGKLVDFAGWDMPVHYGSQISEHHQVRKDAGMFDVSHMTVVDLHGDNVKPFLRKLLANNIDRLKTRGKALYTCMLNEQGGVIDDLIVYYCDDTHYRIVFNAATREKDLSWTRAQGAHFSVALRVRDELAMIAIQGPNAREKTHKVLTREQAAAANALAPFNGVYVGDMFIARTGYTGEDGYEIMLPVGRASEFWEALSRAGVQPCGLGARDTLRLEAGMNLYGTDMDDATSPLESGLTWTVAWEPEDRQFIGRAALEQQKREGLTRQLVGLILVDKSVLRNHLPIVVDGRVAGEITSGSFSPTLGRGIAFARVPMDVGVSCQVEIRGRLLTARVVKPPFVRNGKPCLSLSDQTK